MGDWSPLFGPVGLVVGAAITAWFGLKERKVESSQPDWDSYSSALERRVESQDNKIDELFSVNNTLRRKLDDEYRYRLTILWYLRRVITWALKKVPSHERLPYPPEALKEELRYYFEGERE